MAHDPMSWYLEIPVVSRCFITVATALTAGCFVDLFSPLALYYNYDLIFEKKQYWRLLSSFFYFGNFGIDFLFHMYFVTRYCRLLEEGYFRGRTADYIFMLIFGALLTISITTIIPMFSKLKFLGHPLAFMMVYVWGRSPENIHVRMGFLGIFPFSAPYLPWVLLLFSLCIGNSIENDLLGIIVGHIYYFLTSVYPHVATIRGWRYRNLLPTPSLLHFLCGTEGLDAPRVIDLPLDGVANNNLAQPDQVQEGGAQVQEVNQDNHEHND